MSEINSVSLKAAVKELNEMAIEGIDKIRTVGISVNKMAALFIAACNKVNDTDESLLSDSIIDVYNELPELEDIPAEEEKVAKEKVAKEPKAPKAPKVVKEKVAKEPKAPKIVVEKSRYGHVQSAKSGKLDDMLFTGATIQAMMDECEVPRVRVIGHANHLKNDLGLTLLVTDNKEDSLLSKYKIKEEAYTGTVGVTASVKAGKAKVTKEVVKEEVTED